ncbi:MAG TPA: hypothetical protein VL098_14060, partial [Flavipsychrobacter sp.]|nr:hypothetical protein [Flavipsychrobacter sp.]
MKKYVFFLPRLVLLVALSLAFPAHSYSQSLACPPNIDFEFGNFLLWSCEIGTAQNPPPSTPPATVSFLNTAPSVPTPGRHTITSAASGIDAYGGFSQLAPLGGNYSLKLGNNVTGAQAEKVKYGLTVPVGINNYSFKFKYAVVFEDPGHAAVEQPRFEVNAYDAVTGLPVPCSQQSFVAAASIPGFFTSPTNAGVRYKPWTDHIIVLGGTSGQSVYLEVATGDCTLSGHFGYGYFDLIDCGQFQTAVATCDLDGQGIVLTGPAGYMTYTWYDASWNPVGTPTQTTTFHPTNTVAQAYHLVLTPFPTISTCLDTIDTQPIANVDVQAQPDTSCITLGVPIQ